eukprot:CAMPEP_0172928474 /NCGR_PEP_ID=MMETSP1075-20121228/217994_1 /TAXON_ID=2916 /ORGANISM="Ceratium fusus, Strain PA161109" /LENGTH=492 /DNA_ID=CAMNT_0013789761 /DNA_START=85 /DNA_END=1564 /DNA_ORIENTATION=+
MASRMGMVRIALVLASAFFTAEGAKKFRLRAHRAGHFPREPIHPFSVPNELTQIHMLISAFQDGDRCANTINRALDKARYPDRLSFNVLQAIGPRDVACLEEFRSKLLPKLCSEQSMDCEAATLARIHVWTIPLKEAKGPAHQRGLLSERAILPGQDSMCLSTDSHMSFVDAWDDLLIQDWTSTNNEFAVLTAYPLATRNANFAGTKAHINLCGYFLEGDLPRGVTGATLTNQGEQSKPTLTMNWAAANLSAGVMLKRMSPWTNNEFAVLTAYPLATSNANFAGTKAHINLCGYFLEEDLPRGVPATTLLNQGKQPKPTLTMNWAAGQSFSRCHAEKNVPVDKELRWIFTGEEVDRAVRLWTHGYDLYNPSINAVLHNYTKPNQHFWDYYSDVRDAEEDLSGTRIRALLTGQKVIGGFGTFGLGNQRTLEEYVTWSHTNLGGNWDEYLKLHKLTPNIPDGAPDPDTNPKFCESLERHPVRDAESLAKSALIK